MRKFSIREWAEEDQPRKKLLYKGAHTLTDSELLAILINNGTQDKSAIDIAKDLLASINHDLCKLGSQTVREITSKGIRGLGEAKTITILAALELGVRRNSQSKKKDHIAKSGDIADYLRAKLEYRKEEVFAVVFLNHGNRILHFEIVSEGGLTSTVADPRIILKKALEHNATSLVLCHNHPSGNLTPSRADEMLTQKIKQASFFLDILLVDHIIVSEEGYFSFADQGML